MIRTSVLLVALFSGCACFGQQQLKQIGMKLYDEHGLTVKLSEAVKMSKVKSEKAYLAFQLADYHRDERLVGIWSGIAGGVLALVPTSTITYSNGYQEFRYGYLNIVFAVSAGLDFISLTKKKKIEETMRIGVEAYNSAGISGD